MQTHKFKGKLFDIEYSSVKIGELEGEMRIDSEYYDKYYLDIQNKVIRKNYDYLKNLASNKYQNYKPNGEFFEYIEISGVNTQTGTFQSETLETKNQPLRAKKTVNKNDILISTVRPNRGGVTFINDEKTNIVASTGFCKLSTNKLNPKYLYILFRTNIYRDLLVRNTTATMYPAVSEDDILNFTIPIPSKSFQKKIESLVIESYKQNELAEKLYKEAETLLLTELNLLNYQTKTKKIKFDGNYEIDAKENHSITNYSILKELDRFDAEYWDYSYFEIVEKIKNYRGGFDKLSNLIKISKKKIILDEEKLYNYIELADINKSNGMVENITEILGKELPSRARMKIEKGSVLFSSLEGSIDKVAIIDSELQDLVASTGFFIFKENILNKETLLVLLKIFGQNYIAREALGTIMSAISNTGIERILLPKIDLEIQKIVTERIQKSFESKTKSKKLLEVAKKAVEIYIEEDEKIGLKFIEDNL